MAPTPPDPETPSAGEAASLKFRCPCCEMILEVPAVNGGAKGPCPGCRREIQAPFAPKKIEIKPRPAKRSKTGAAEASPSIPPGYITPTPFEYLGTVEELPEAAPGRPPSMPPGDSRPPVTGPQVPVAPLLPAATAGTIPPAAHPPATAGAPGPPPASQTSFAKAPPAVTVPPPKEGAPASPQAALPEKKFRPRRTINPGLGISEHYEERKEIGALIQIILAVLVTVGVVACIVVVVRNRLDPPPEPSRHEVPVGRPAGG